MDYYAILGVKRGAGFETLKKAYYRRAKECHPDRFEGSLEKAEEFKRLVQAFNVLSDPLQRGRYDAVRSMRPEDRPSAREAEVFAQADAAILDTIADDILEEMIVGNTIPEKTSLQTLMLDLEKTERFVMFREAKNLFYANRIADAAQLFRHYSALAPDNILAHYYLARCYVLTRRFRRAEKEYAAAVRIGSRRFPPLRLTRLRRELSILRRKHLGFLGKVRDAFADTAGIGEPLPPDEEMRRAVSRTINNILRQDARRLGTGRGGPQKGT